VKAYVVCVEIALIHNNVSAFHVLKNPSFPKEKMTFVGLLFIIKLV
jgi:hypothetical protein